MSPQPSSNFRLEDGAILTAEDFAKKIYISFVKDEPEQILFRLGKLIGTKISPDKRAEFDAKFLAKLHLYCEASALRILLTANKPENRYEQLLEEFEKIIFPYPPNSEGIKKLAAIRAAMIDLQRMIDTPHYRHFSWARDWLLEIGCDETNPEALYLFGALFAPTIKNISQIVGKSEPR